MLEAITTRLTDRVDDLRRVEGATEFDAVRRSGLPTSTPAAYVLPLGLRASAPDAAAGTFSQPLSETVAVVLVFSSGDPSGKRAIPHMREIILAVVHAIVGWAPGEQIGVFALNRGWLVSSERGLFAYQLDFSISDQLRVTP